MAPPRPIPRRSINGTCAPSRSTQASCLAPGFATDGERCDAREDLLKAVEQVYPREEPEPEGLLPSIKLRPYQKQSLAFCIDVERSKDVELLGYRGQRGGIIADEMGMGKTMVRAPLLGP